MPVIEFMENDLGALKLVEAPAGGDLVDICDEFLAPVPFSCRSASCATCQIEVVEGLELLEPARHDELELLDLLGGPGNSRLACQARVKPGAGRIRLKPIGT